jgi:hypothetical protein
MWGAWRGFGLGVAVLCVLLRAHQIKRVLYFLRLDRFPPFAFTLLVWVVVYSLGGRR